MAAAENTGVAHILFSQLSGITEGRMRPADFGVYSLFVRLKKYLSPDCPCQDTWLRIMDRKYNLKTDNALRLLSG